MTMTDTPSSTGLAPEQDDKHVQYGKTGGPARLAVLQHLAQHPAGATFEALSTVICQAVGRQLAHRSVLQVLMSMRTDNKLAREGQAQGAGQPHLWLWYSPVSRQAAFARGHWRPGIAAAATASPTARTTDGPAEQAAAVAHSRGLSINATTTP